MLQNQGGRKWKSECLWTLTMLDQLVRKSRSDYFVYVNSSLVAWLSKRQATIETSVFGAEFVAMKIGMEYLRGLHYKLRMMGVPLAGLSLIYGDNM